MSKKYHFLLKDSVKRFVTKFKNPLLNTLRKSMMILLTGRGDCVLAKSREVDQILPYLLNQILPYRTVTTLGFPMRGMLCFGKLVNLY